MATRIRVVGMVPFFTPPKEDSRIIMNTMPDAPSRAVPGKKMNCTSPDTRAVNRMAHSTFQLPKRSSRLGPSTRMSTMLPM